MLNNVTDLLSVVLSGTLGRSGRKRAKRATKFLSGHRGFLSTSAIIGAAGVAWGIYDTMKGNGVPGVPGGPGVQPVNSQQQVPPLPNILTDTFDPVARIVRLAVSAAKADGTLSEQERALIVARARDAGLEAAVEAELAQTRPLADIVRGVTDPAIKKELYVLAFTIVRADESVSGAERIYLAQLAHQLGLDAAATRQIEDETAARIDSQTDN